MAFTKGQSGNPRGRPKKERALTAILEAAGSKTVEVDGKRISGKQLIAQMVWQAALTGKVIFADKSEASLVDGTDWVNLIKFIYNQVDGPPKGELDITSGGEPIKQVTLLPPQPPTGDDE